MTNAEKFKEVFGYDVVNDLYVVDPCDFVGIDDCRKHSCHDCPLFNFWNEEYKEKENG